MQTAVLIAFTVAGACSLLGTPIVRAVAIATDFVDNPSHRKVHQRAVPYLGGLAIMVATLCGVLATVRSFHPTPFFGGLVLLGCAMGLLGLVDDSRSLGAGTRLALQLAAGTGAVLLGTRLDLTGVVVVDGAITVVFIAAITNSLNLLDNMDGLSGGVALGTGIGIAAIGALLGQPVLAVSGAAIVGATLGYLAYNIRPAMLFMGDGGAVFLGFLLAVLSVRAGLPVGRGLDRLAGLATTGLLLVVPILDTLTVCVARVRRGIPVSQGGKDHLSHRLVRRGLPPGAAVGALVAANLTAAGITFLMADQRIGVAAALLLAALAVGAVVVPAWATDVYPADDPRVVAAQTGRSAANSAPRPATPEPPGGSGAATPVDAETVGAA